jgi:hypothetical protein
MVGKLLVSLFIWEGLIPGGIALYLLLQHGQLNGEEGQGIFATAILGVLVVLLCSWICRTMKRRTSAVAGFAIGFATSIAGGLVWGFFATDRSFALPYQLVYLGFLLSIPSGIGGAVVGYFQGRTP